jgi:hypothetical protein
VRRLCLRCGRPFTGRGSYCPDHAGIVARERAGRAGDEPRRLRKGPAYRRWRKAVVARDGRCTFGDRAGEQPVCLETREAELDAHHVTPLVDGGAPYDVDNGRALCRRHHAALEQELRRARR